MLIRRALAVCAAAALLLAGGAVPARAATVDASYNVWTWNVAGWKLNRGSTTNGLIPALANSIRNRSSHFAALNELCWSQYKAVQANLRNSGWPQDVENFSRFEPHNETGCGGEPFGVAIFSRAPLGAANRYALAADGSSETRKLLCAPLEARPKLRFCTTHITPSNEVIGGQKINERQLGEVLGRLEAFHGNGDTVIVAGDFNAQPNYGRLDGWYSASLNHPNNTNNRGAYRELDDTESTCYGYGEKTQESGDLGPCGQVKKVDLIFVRESRIVGSYSGDSLAIATNCGGLCSDHRILVGTVTVSITV
ncbi:endonuclease/exonuclease/phosphatase family protein [Micromonospora sp. WMMD1082]|uniref:endonuclease/exonuclease/phosphatase family protein n=1 Tax=Micromonospora sp. WMMD1082 TaxID=3016104 RepID=UPI0024170957|nr:endonuclease/exonuclease/phosphatase family protein [Micromonospora sp. WMMD1082]MDG4794868.1 endonuclease/exonuclease/phosphatase family protein [Micromonospora sp. WMMD1082]